MLETLLIQATLAHYLYHHPFNLLHQLQHPQLRLLHPLRHLLHNNLLRRPPNRQLLLRHLNHQFHLRLLVHLQPHQLRHLLNLRLLHHLQYHQLNLSRHPLHPHLQPNLPHNHLLPHQHHQVNQVILLHQAQVSSKLVQLQWCIK